MVRTLQTHSITDGGFLRESNVAGSWESQLQFPTMQDEVLFSVLGSNLKQLFTQIFQSNEVRELCRANKNYLTNRQELDVFASSLTRTT